MMPAMLRHLSTWRLLVAAVIVCLHGQGTRAQEFTAGIGKLKRFTIDTSSNNIYIGGVNSIFILDSDLTLQHDVTTGPIRDDEACIDLDVDGEARERDCNLQLTDNHNKVLVLYNDSLITCGSVLQGTCERRHLVDASVEQDYHVYRPHQLLAAPTPNDEYETVAFVAPGPRCQLSQFTNTEDVLYTALSLYYVDGRENEFSFISTHQVAREDRNYLRYAHFDNAQTLGTYSYFLDIGESITHRIVRSGFTLGSFTYVTFLANVDNGATSRVAQVCVEDCRYHSYVEMPLECVSDGREYNLIQTSEVSSAGSELAAQLGIAEGDSVLVASFRDGTSITQYGTDSAVCVYSLNDIRLGFTENIQKCHNGDYGSVEMGTEFVQPYRCTAVCIPRVLFYIVERSTLLHRQCKQSTAYLYMYVVLLNNCIIVLKKHVPEGHYNKMWRHRLLTTITRALRQ